MCRVWGLPPLCRPGGVRRVFLSSSSRTPGDTPLSRASVGATASSADPARPESQALALGRRHLYALAALPCLRTGDGD